MAGKGIRLDPPAATMLVDDERVVRTMLRAYLERSGYHVLEADSGETAQKIAEQSFLSISLRPATQRSSVSYRPTKQYNRIAKGARH